MVNKTPKIILWYELPKQGLRKTQSNITSIRKLLIQRCVPTGVLLCFSMLSSDAIYKIDKVLFI